MTSRKKSQFGGLPPRYKFMLNPYPDQRISRCPLCDNKAGQRKLPLLIHVDPEHFIALNYTCRYCRDCDLLIGDRHNIEHLLAELFRQYDPLAIGNKYLIIGTMAKEAWREGIAQPNTIGDTLLHTSDFAKYYQDLQVTRPGWYQAGQVAPVIEPPLSKEWIKLAE